MPSHTRRSAIDTSLHQTRRHIPREADALHPVEEDEHHSAVMSPCAAADENQVSRRLAHLFSESGQSCPAESAPSSNERNTAPACPGHVSAGWARLCRPKDGLARRSNDVQSLPWASILPYRDLRRVEIRSWWRHSRY